MNKLRCACEVTEKDDVISVRMSHSKYPVTCVRLGDGDGKIKVHRVEKESHWMSLMAKYDIPKNE